MVKRKSKLAISKFLGQSKAQRDLNQSMNKDKNKLKELKSSLIAIYEANK